ncbi:hypothetical protein ABZZ17_31645 [Streptomyces sp. NPDC006512]|uniref:hypothetical protein n=1 Tax=Streptomyces sp. NPDC006512 TaxID=3154307 RepID=UPI0033BC95F5
MPRRREVPAEGRAVGMLDGLDAVDWKALETVQPDRPATEVPKALRRLGREDAATRPKAVERACVDLQDLLLGWKQITSAATAALPFLVDLVLAPDGAARPDLVDLLVYLAENAENAGSAENAGAADTGAGDPASVDPGWGAAWRTQGPRLHGLLRDADPAIRRSALQLFAGRTGLLLDRWREETDPAVRVAVLLSLGEAAAAEDPAHAVVTEVRALLDRVFRAEDRVMRVAAVVATAHLDARSPQRAYPVLLDALTDPALAPAFEAVWYLRDCEYPYHRDDVAARVDHLLEPDTPARARFVTDLAAAGNRTGDAGLRRCALDLGWRLLVDRPSAADALLPVAAALLDDPDDGVRYRAAHLMAVLGRRAAPHADRLAGLLDDPGEAEYFDGTVGGHARWALTRIGDPRALPDLVERLVAPYRDLPGRGYAPADPRQPDVADVLRPLREHAALLLPAVREALRDEIARGGWLVTDLREVLLAWGEDPLLPGETIPYPQWAPPPMERERAEATVLAFAVGGEPLDWTFAHALAALDRHGPLAPPVRAALEALTAGDRRVSRYGDYRAILEDEELRARIGATLTGGTAAMRPGATADRRHRGPGRADQG